MYMMFKMSRQFLVMMTAMLSCMHTDGLKVLMVPMPISSHIIMFSRVANALTNQGHKIAMVLPNNTKLSLVPIQVDLHIFEGVGEENIFSSPALSEILLRSKFATSTMEFFRYMFNMDELVVPVMRQECKNFLDDEALREQLISEKFDFAILDQVAFPCSMNYPIVLGLDYFLFSIPAFTWISRVPDLPSFIPDIHSGKYNDQMTLWDRMQNTLIYLATYNMVNTTNPIDMSKYPPGRPIADLRTIQENALFWFWLDDPAVSFVRPHMPNTVSIGDIMVQEGKPLPESFQTFLDTAPEGVILISFGSFVDYIPEDILVKLCAAFGEVQEKLIWKSKTPPPCADRLKEKMMVVSWMPQNDILAHDNLKLFITHCGLNSILEAVYHAKPMLGFPVSLDQPYNAKIVEAKGYGLTMNLAEFSNQELIDNVNKIIENEKIAEKLRLGANLLRDKPDSAEQRLGYWLNHVKKYGADHLRTGAYKLSMPEFLLLDVLLTFVVIATVAFILLLCVFWYVLKYCKRCFGCFVSKVKVE